MNCQSLVLMLEKLPARESAYVTRFESELGPSRRDRWYHTQREHLVGWLSDYQGPGAYSRKGGPNRDARFFWSHFQCAPGLFWLAEAAGVDRSLLEKAATASCNAGKYAAAQCAAFRRVVPWHLVERGLRERNCWLAA